MQHVDLASSTWFIQYIQYVTTIYNPRLVGRVRNFSMADSEGDLGRCSWPSESWSRRDHWCPHAPKSSPTLEKWFWLVGFRHQNTTLEYIINKDSSSWFEVLESHMYVCTLYHCLSTKTPAILHLLFYRNRR
jgi:hypothetical protein